MTLGHLKPFRELTSRLQAIGIGVDGIERTSGGRAAVNVRYTSTKARIFTGTNPGGPRWLDNLVADAKQALRERGAVFAHSHEPEPRAPEPPPSPEPAPAAVAASPSPERAAPPSVADVPKKRGGWPKGRPRGPRAVAAPVRTLSADEIADAMAMPAPDCVPQVVDDRVVDVPVDAGAPDYSLLHKVAEVAREAGATPIRINDDAHAVVLNERLGDQLADLQRRIAAFKATAESLGCAVTVRMSLDFSV